MKRSCGFIMGFETSNLSRTATTEHGLQTLQDQ